MCHYFEQAIVEIIRDMNNVLMILRIISDFSPFIVKKVHKNSANYLLSLSLISWKPRALKNMSLRKINAYAVLFYSILSTVSITFLVVLCTFLFCMLVCTHSDVPNADNYYFCFFKFAVIHLPYCLFVLWISNIFLSPISYIYLFFYLICIN